MAIEVVNVTTPVTLNTGASSIVVTSPDVKVVVNSGLGGGSGSGAVLVNGNGTIWNGFNAVDWGGTLIGNVLVNGAFQINWGTITPIAAFQALTTGGGVLSLIGPAFNVASTNVNITSGTSFKIDGAISTLLGTVTNVTSFDVQSSNDNSIISRIFATGGTTGDGQSKVLVKANKNLIYLGLDDLTALRGYALYTGSGSSTLRFAINEAGTWIANLGSDAIGDIYQRNGTNNFSRLASVATGNALISGGVAAVNSWGKIGLTTHISGVLPLANGGTGVALTDPNANILYGWDDADNAFTAITLGTNLLYTHATHTLSVNATTVINGAANNEIPKSNGVDLVPSGLFSTSAGVVTTGTWNATKISEVYGGTNQTAYGTGDILYASGVNTLARRAATTNGFVLTLSGGIPVWASVAGTGTVTGVAWTTSQGVSASIATPTTTPNITITLGTLTGVTSINGLVITANTGVITTGAWTATAVSEVYGGTNQTSYTAGDILYASGANTLAKLPISTNGFVLTLSGGLPIWASPTGGGLTNPMTTIGDIIQGTTAGVPVRLADVAVGSYLRSGGVATPVSWSTTTIPDTVVIGDLWQGTATNIVTTLTAVAVGNALISGGVATANSWGKITDAHVNSTVAITTSGQTFTGVNIFTSPQIQTSITTSSATLNIFTANVSTVTMMSAVTTFTMSGTSQAAVTATFFANATNSGVTKTINIGTNGLSGSITNINLGSASAGALGSLVLNSTTILGKFITISATGGFTFTQTAQASGWTPQLNITPGAHTSMTAATEFRDYDFGTRTATWLAGTTATQRFTHFRGQTVAGASASATFTDLYTVYIDPSIVGSNAIVTNNWALGLGGGLKLFAGTTTRPALVLPTGTNLTSSLAGAIENDGTHLWVTFANGGARAQLDNQVTSFGWALAGNTLVADGIIGDVGTSGFKISLYTNNTARQVISSTGNQIFTQDAQSATHNFLGATQSAHTGGTPFFIKFTGGAHTTLAAGASYASVQYLLAQTVQFASNTTVSTAIGLDIRPTQYAFVTAGGTITQAASLNIVGGPVSGTNATITDSHGILISSASVGSGTNSYGITVNAMTGATNNYSAQFIGGIGIKIGQAAQSSLHTLVQIIQAAHTGGTAIGISYTGGNLTTMTVGQEIVDLYINGNRTIQHATGASTTQRSAQILPPTHSFVGASTITDAATLLLNGAPVAGTNATITNTHTLLIAGGPVGAGTVNSYGITVNASTTATTNYAAQFLGGNVGIGISAPLSTLDVSGSIGSNTRTITTSATLTATDHTVLCDSTGGVVAVTLPAAAGAKGRIYVVKKIDASANNVTLATVDGGTKTITTRYSGFAVQSDSALWYVIASF